MRYRVDSNTFQPRSGNKITMKAYAPVGEQGVVDVSPVMLNQTGLTNPNAQNTYRQRFGRSISLARIETALRAAHGGCMMQLTDLARETVETDPHLGAVLNKRFGAVSCLPFEVRPATGTGIDKDKAIYYATVVWEQLKNLTHFRRALKQLSWSLFDGRAAVELFWKQVAMPKVNGYGSVGLAVTSTGWIHPRRLSFGPHRELVVTEEMSTIGGGNFSVAGLVLDAMPLGKFVTWQPQLFGEYQEREGLAPRCMCWSFFKRYSQRDRMILLELFGKPWRIVEVSEESQASPEDLSAAEDAADGLGGAFTARMPRGVKLNVVQPGRTAGQVHQEVIEECDKQISKLVLGQTGTTDGVPAGLNSNQASVMQDEQLMILTSDAVELSEVVETQLTDRIIAANFGEQELPHAPMFVLRSDLPADRSKEVERLTAALNAGLEISLSEAYEISGFRRPEKMEAVLRIDQPPTPPLAPTPPAARAVIVWPQGTSPPAGEQQPLTPQAAEDEGARESAIASVGAPDQPATVTVNEVRESQGRDPLMLPDGTPDPDGDLTVAEFRMKRATAKPNAAPTQLREGAGSDNSGGSFEPRLAPAPLAVSHEGSLIQMVVRKNGSKWCVYSEDGSRSFGCYGTKKEAEDRLRQIEYFKHAEDGETEALNAGEIAKIELASESERMIALSANIILARQPDTVNGSPEDLLDKGKPELQRAVNRWAAQYLDAFVGADSAKEVTDAAIRTAEHLDSRPFARALERRLVHSTALGALDSWYDEEGETVEPAKFAEPTAAVVEPKFASMRFDKAMKYFRDKNIVTRAAFDRLSATAKQKAFTVAALTQQQMLHLVHAELARHIGQGADIRTFAESFKERLKSAGFVAASPKAEAAYIDNVFRTNVLGAYNAGRYERQTQPSVLRARPYWQNRTVSDNRRRETHGRADGLVLHATDAFWQRAYPPYGWNCFLPGTEIEGRVIGASKSFYSGQIVELSTAIGSRLTVTANHPILTSHGFVAAKDLIQSDYLVCNGRKTGVSFLRGRPKRNHNNAPAVVEDVFHALAQSGVSFTSSYGSNDFHGEASRFNGDVEVVGSYRELLYRYNIAVMKQIMQFIFESSTSRKISLMSFGLPCFSIDRNRHSFTSVPSSAALLNYFASIRFNGLPFHEFRLGPSSQLDAVFVEDSVNNLSADISLISQLFDRSAGQVRFDKIINIKKCNFMGHVYDLESPLGWVTANGIYTSNCRCRVVSLSEKQAANMVITSGSSIDYLPDPGFVSGVRSLLSARWERTGVTKAMLEE